jgi:hypothetical protein
VTGGWEGEAGNSSGVMYEESGMWLVLPAAGPYNRGDLSGLRSSAIASIEWIAFVGVFAIGQILSTILVRNSFPFLLNESRPWPSTTTGFGLAGNRLEVGVVSSSLTVGTGEIKGVLFVECQRPLNLLDRAEVLSPLTLEVSSYMLALDSGRGSGLVLFEFEASRELLVNTQRLVSGRRLFCRLEEKEGKMLDTDDRIEAVSSWSLSVLWGILLRRIDGRGSGSARLITVSCT